CFVRDLGLYLCVYTVPNYLKLDRMEIQYSELGRVAAIWSSRGDANAKACFGFTAPAHVDLQDRARQQQVLTNTYAGIGGEVPRLLARTFTSMRRRRSVWLTGPKVELCWQETPAIAPHPCLVKARVSHSSVPMCWLENWLRHPVTTKLRFINMNRRCVPSLRSIRRSGSNLQT